MTMRRKINSISYFAGGKNLFEYQSSLTYCAAKFSALHLLTHASESTFQHLNNISRYQHKPRIISRYLNPQVVEHIAQMAKFTSSWRRNEIKQASMRTRK